MRTELIKAWAKRPVPAEDLALILGIHYQDFIQIMSGEKELSENHKKIFADLFDEPVEKLFPTDDLGDFVDG